MNKFSFLLLGILMTLCLFTACVDDKEVVPEIVGKWKYAAKVPEVVKTSSTDADVIIKSYLDKKMSRFRKLEVDEDGLVLGDGVFVGIVAMQGSHQVINFLGEVNYTQFNIQGNVLSVWFDITQEIVDRRYELELTPDMQVIQVIVREDYVLQ